MAFHPVADRGDVFWINPNPVAGREMKDRHPFVVITLREINRLGICMAVPITSGGQFARSQGLTVPIQGKRIQGVAICNQIRSFDLSERISRGDSSYIETLDGLTMDEIINRVVSVIDPGP